MATAFAGPARDFSELVTLAPMGTHDEVHGTTVLAVRYRGGVLILSDRRATAGNLIMFDKAEKVLALDE